MKVNAAFNDSPLTEVRTLTRDEVVPYYVHLILSDAPDEEIKRVNKLILTKWTSSGLLYIKEKAWAKVELAFKK